MSSSDDEKMEFRGTFEIYRAGGESLYKNGHYKKAVDTFTQALEERPGDKDCLVMRSKCHVALGNLEPALKDAEATLKNSAEYYRGVHQKAEVLYAAGDFETALIFFHRGHKLRPEKREFRLGVQKCEEAIDNALGGAGVQLTTDGDLAYFEEQNTQPGGGGGAPKKTTRRKPQSAGAGGGGGDVKRLLGELYGDKVYLEKLLKDIDDKTDSGKEIQGLATDGIEYLNKRADFWRQQQPAAPPRSASAKAGNKGGKGKKGSASAASKDDPQTYILKQLDLIEKEQSEGKYPESLKRCRRCLKQLKGYPDGTVTNRQELIAHIESCMGNSYMEQGSLDQAITHFEKDLEISRKEKSKEGEARALGNLGRAQARKGQYEQAIDSWRGVLSLLGSDSGSELEVMWLQHELGRCHLELGQLDEALSCGGAALEAATSAGDDVWTINAQVLVAQCQLKQGRLEEALDSFGKGLELAEKQKDEPLQNAINTAMADIMKKLPASEQEESTPAIEESGAATSAGSGVTGAEPGSGASEQTTAGDSQTHTDTKHEDSDTKQGNDTSDPNKGAPPVDKTEVAETTVDSTAQHNTHQDSAKDSAKDSDKDTAQDSQTPEKQ